VSELYFAYGSNMSTARLVARVAGARALGRARLVVFNKPGIDGSGKANVVSDPGSRVWGVLYRIELDDWPTLDRFEPGYVRERRAVVCERRGCISAFLYRWIEEDAETAPFTAPFDWYRAHLIEGAREHGLPPSYLRGLEEVAALGAPEPAARPSRPASRRTASST
jgi:gamma-glutamylcyclotransferase